MPGRSGDASFQPPARTMRRTWISTRLPTIAPRAGTPRQRRAASPGVRGAARASIATSRPESARERRHRATAGRLSADPACLPGPPRHGAKAPAPRWPVAGAAVQPARRTYSEDIDLDVRGEPCQVPGAEPWAPNSRRSMPSAGLGPRGRPTGHDCARHGEARVRARRACSEGDGRLVHRVESVSTPHGKCAYFGPARSDRRLIRPRGRPRGSTYSASEDQPVAC